jgi:phenylacetate-coenzyme A ligase PaaK-like adenylate-forming protein
MHHEPCPCGNPSPWLELEGRTDDVTTFTEDGKEIRIAPLSVYAVLKEVHELRRFQVLAYPGNRLELRLEENDGASRTEAFETAKKRLENYLASQGIRHVTITLSETSPQQDPNSGKYKHIVNMQKESATV